MAAFGVGEIFAGIIFGKIIDKFGSKLTTIGILVSVVFCAVSTIANIVSLQFGFGSVLLCFSWGFMDGATNVHVNEILGFEFKTKSEPYSVYNIWQGLGVFFF